MPVFLSSGQHGYSPDVERDARHVAARKLERTVLVRFAEAPCAVQTLEGVVQARPGDAIVRGEGGHEWRVSRAKFLTKYRPVAPTREGEPGTYRSRPYRVLALRMESPFEVVLTDGVSRLAGRPGDWLVDYGDGSLGIVEQSIFASTYEVVA